MRLLRIIVIVMLLVVSVLFAYTQVSESINGGSVAPVISCDEGILDISVLDDQNALFRGVTASDAQDGDLTDQICIAGISKFVGDATVNVTYLVFDSDDNVGRLTRMIHYTDYTSPRVEITQPLIYRDSQSIKLLDRLSVWDCIDGDITDSVRVSSLIETVYDYVYKVSLAVTNSMGDTAEIELPVVWYHNNQERPVVVLKDSLVYVKQGSSFNVQDYIVRAETAEGAVNKSEVEIIGSVDTAIAGTYMVRCSYEENGLEGVAVLTVVVE